MLHSRLGLMGSACLVMLLTSLTAGTVAAAPPALPPLTKLRLTVVQFVPTTGDYKRWDALGGELEVGPDGTVVVPTLGSIDVNELSADQLGLQIGQRLQLKLGLLNAPEASVQVLSYPPVYLVGNVTTPGEYTFRPGMTVTHALALAGGEQRDQAPTGYSETIKLELDLNTLSNDIIRSTARIARLKTQLSRAEQITFPPELHAGEPVVAEIIDQEQRIFRAHGNEFGRQQTSLLQLGELYNAEIDALGQKAAAVEAQIAQAQEQVDAVTSLVSAGSATVSRLSEAERNLANLRSDQIDNVIATMTARENLNRSQRDLAKLQDEQQSSASMELQQEQAVLERLLLNRDATMRLLRQSVESDETFLLTRNARSTLNFTILRQEQGKMVVLDANEDSPLYPGDVVKATLHLELPANVQPASLASSSGG